MRQLSNVDHDGRVLPDEAAKRATAEVTRHIYRGTCWPHARETDTIIDQTEPTVNNRLVLPDQPHLESSPLAGLNASRVLPADYFVSRRSDAACLLRNRNMKFVFGNLIVAGCLVLGYWLYQDTGARVDAESTGKSDKPLVAVEVAPLKSAELEERTELTGSLQAESRIQVRARVSAYIRQLPFDIGDRVDTTKAIVQLDDAHHQELVTSATAALRVAEAQKRSKEEELKQADNNVRRLIELRTSGVSTQQQLEQTQSAMAVAQAEVDLAEARVEEARSNLQSAQLALKETTIDSPISGIVAERFVEPGDLAHPDDVLLTIIDLSRVRTLVHVVERDYARVKIGQQAEVTVDALPGETFRGTITRKAPIIDEATRTAAVQIEIDNDDGTLRPGMHARVAIILKQLPEADAVPVTALLDRDGGTSVFMLESDGETVREVPVQTGLRDNGMVEILGGLPSDAEVVTLGSHLIEDGQQIEPVRQLPTRFGLASKPGEAATGPIAGE